MILVTGGAGYVGSHAVLALQAAGEAVIVLDDLSSGSAEAVPKGVELVVGDIADQELLTRLLAERKVQTIMHLAAKTNVAESVSEPADYYLTNTVKSAAMLQVAVEAGITNLIFSSTAAVYAAPGPRPVSECWTKSPASPYGKSKLMVEEMLADYETAYGLRSVCLRYFNVAGADPSMRSGQSTSMASHLIKVAVQTALGSRPNMEIFGDDYPTPDGTCIRDYVHVSDIADAHLVALDYLRAGGKSTALNCGYGKGYSVMEVLDSTRRVSGMRISALLVERRRGDLPQIVAAADEILRLGWKPRFQQLDTIITHALSWESTLIFNRSRKAH